MKINYDNAKSAFDNYIEECKRKIKNTFFPEEYLKGFSQLRNSLITSGKIGIDNSITDAIKYERLQMIDIKINHTMRVVEDVLKMAEKMETPVDFNKVLTVSALLHDIGRFDQATWNNSFSDACYKNVEGINNHAEAGYHILFKEGRIEDYKIDKNLYRAIGTVVYNHGNPVLSGDLAVKLKDVRELDVHKLRGINSLNESEKTIVATLVQMVRDVDMLDILYQHLTNEFPVIRDFVNFDVLGESIYDIARYWDINPKDILEYNGISESDVPSMNMIKIPVSKIDLKKLEVPQDIKEKFYNNENIDLKETMARRDWTFITGMWWRLNHFLNNISFTSNLQLIEEKKLLDKIYSKYPDEYKFLVMDAFLYAEEMLIKRQLENNDSNIYVERNSIKL